MFILIRKEKIYRSIEIRKESHEQSNKNNLEDVMPNRFWNSLKY